MQDVVVSLSKSVHSTRAATYKVIINTLKGLPNTTLDAAFGLPALVALYAIRITFAKLSIRYPSKGEEVLVLCS